MSVQFVIPHKQILIVHGNIITNTTRTAIGRALLAWSDIKINGTPATRTGELFHLPITLSPGQNSTQPVWKDIVVNSLIGGGNLPTKHFWYARTPTVPTYDTDGNLTNDGRWTYLWDAENRLIQMETTDAATHQSVNHPYIKVKAKYDAQGRRLSRTVWQGGTAASPTFKSSHRYLYDGWNVVTEFRAPSETSPTLTRQTTLTWGLDLSNTPQDAGGVSGLLSQSEIVNSQIVNYYPSYDGNGNIIAWSQQTSTAPIARREYDAFGNTLVSEGTWPSSYGFSTKPQDTGTGLYYYGYRYYDPVTGRWPSRDPIEEEGGLNLYGFIGNNGVNWWDLLGLLKDGDNFDSVKIKKMHIKWAVVFGFKAGDGYGHWWFELDGSESYGWWPAEGLNLAKTLRGVRGDLNGQTLFLGTPTTDPHHGDPAEENYSAKLNFGGVLGFFANKELEYGSGKGTKCKCATSGEIKDCLRDFAKSYSGQWSHPWGNSCHDFLVEALDACCLED